MTRLRKTVTGVLTAALCITLIVPAGAEGAAKKPKLSKSKLSVKTGKTVTLKVKNAAKAKISWKSNKKKIAKVKASGKYGCKITGVKRGNAVITCRIKKGRKTTTLKCKVTVQQSKKIEPSEKTPVPANTPPAIPAPVVTPPVPETPTPAPTPDPNSILGKYNDIFPYLGNCLNSWQLQDAETMNHVKKHYNSFTLENEMKPNSLLGFWATPISKKQASEKGYILPDTYTETYVPQLNFEQLDKALESAYDNGLKMRGHTLLWHSQTPQWFFVKDYKNGADVVTPEVMDARLEFYISTVMSHVMEKEIELTGEAGSIVYAWDVVNEYLHHGYAGNITTWTSVYGEQNLKPTYVKKAYELAYEQLVKYEAQDKVTLFYNDYDTYFNSSQLVRLVDYINEDEDAYICGGIGMQTHLDVDRPTLDVYKKALDMFLETGLEIQITELDVTINWDHKSAYDYSDEGQTDEDQAAYVRDFMEMVINTQKHLDKTINPKGITSLTIWGLCDSVSWRGGFQQKGNSRPTLFDTSINDPKPSFEEFLSAAEVWKQP